MSIGRLDETAAQPEKPRKAMDPSRVSHLLTGLVLAFEQFNPDAVEPYLAELASYLSEEQLTPITKRVDAFDFTGAKAQTLKLAEVLNIAVEGHDDG
jgi:hypothetical protein